MSDIKTKQFTEYGYRGLEEIRMLRSKIQELHKYIKNLEEKLNAKKDN